jgi:amino acid transporter
MTFVGKVPDQYQQSAYGFNAVLTGVNNLVYSYGGALLFVAFLAEMRHPLDFWKGLTIAMLFITCVYIIFGAVVSIFCLHSSLIFPPLRVDNVN